MDIKLRANAARPAPATPASPATSTPAQPAQPQATTLPQPGLGGEFASTSEPFDQALSEDSTGQGWALHLAQGAAGKRPDFVAQLRQHLQNLPAHEQVAVHLQRAVREGTNKFSIQLSPAELGNIHVKLEIDEEKRVTAAVTVERPSTLELLQRDTKGLERALHNAGLNMEGGDLSFSLGRGDQDFAQDLRQSGASATGGSVLDAESDGDQPEIPVAQVTDTAAGVVNLQV
jgi:flagellar hook-length control protein FliK